MCRFFLQGLERWVRSGYVKGLAEGISAKGEVGPKVQRKGK